MIKIYTLNVIWPQQAQHQAKVHLQVQAHQEAQ